MATDVDAQREATHFKNRVLDLIDIFVRRQPTSPLIVRTILPLVELIVGTGPDEKQLSDKAMGILRNRIGKSKEVPTTVSAGEVEDARGLLPHMVCGVPGDADMARRRGLGDAEAWEGNDHGVAALIGKSAFCSAGLALDSGAVAAS